MIAENRRNYGRSIHNISSSQEKEKTFSRVSYKDEDKRRPECSEKKKGQGPQKIDSLKTKKDFQAVFQSGRRYTRRHLIVYALPNNLNRIRYGLAVSRKIGSSVVRNRVKRIIRESIRHSLKIISAKRDGSILIGYDIVVVPRKICVNAKTYDLVPELTKILRTL
jgi:ribonuclease P protein component